VQPTSLGPPCLFRDMACLVALQLQGKLCGLVASARGNVALVSALLQRLDEDQERDWVDFFLQELLQARAVSCLLI
jgi:hypothetical protein